MPQDSEGTGISEQQELPLRLVQYNKNDRAINVGTGLSYCCAGPRASMSRHATVAQHDKQSLWTMFDSIWHSPVDHLIASAVLLLQVQVFGACGRFFATGRP
jgi:hypothetical protein